MIRQWVSAAGLTAALMVPSSQLAASQRIWDFDVYLDDDLVGSHSFSVADRGTDTAVSSAARFNVKLLLLNVYSYEHSAEEVWRGDCLARLSAKTNDNGDQLEVDGAAGATAFHLTRRDQSADLPQCVMTFAYWNPAILRQKSLLNPQTGEYLPVRIQSRGWETLTSGGQTLRAERYQLDAGKFQIDLWYDIGHQWVALDSKLDNGRRLRYRIKNPTESVVR